MILKKVVSVILLYSFLIVQLIGCATYSDIKKTRDLPGVTHHYNYESYYDQSILAYRLKEKGNPVVRDSAGKKVRAEDELKRISEAKLAELDSEKNRQAKLLPIVIIYMPIAAVLGVVEGFIYFPFNMALAHYEKKLKKNTEIAYVSGRKYFDNKEFEKAISEYERALYLMPSLRSESDIDYWRGRTFEAIGKGEESKYAYLMFIEYSERTIPMYFSNKFSSDSSWIEKAKEVQDKADSINVKDN